MFVFVSVFYLLALWLPHCHWQKTRPPWCWIEKTGMGKRSDYCGMSFLFIDESLNFHMRSKYRQYCYLFHKCVLFSGISIEAKGQFWFSGHSWVSSHLSPLLSIFPSLHQLQRTSLLDLAQQLSFMFSSSLLSSSLPLFLSLTSLTSWLLFIFNTGRHLRSEWPVVSGRQKLRHLFWRGQREAFMEKEVWSYTYNLTPFMGFSSISSLCRRF